MRRLAAVGITTREACGNSRAQRHRLPARRRLPRRGVRRHALRPGAACASCSAIPTRRTSGASSRSRSPAAASTPAAWSTCTTWACIAVTSTVDGDEQRGFEIYVGGGLGAVPHQAKLFDEFVPEEEILPLAQAISRVFARLGEKKNRARARIKFLVEKLGIDEFTRLVLEERAKLPPDPRWTAYLADAPAYTRDAAQRPAPALNGAGSAGGLRPLAPHQRLRQQRQTGLLRGRPSRCRSATSPSDQMRALADDRAHATSATRCARRSSRTSCCAG